MNIHTFKTYSIKTDRSILSGIPFQTYQFERIGYFCIDQDTNSQTENVVVNYTIPLKEDKDKDSKS